MNFLILFYILIGCKKNTGVNNAQDTQKTDDKIVPANVDSNLRLVEIFPNVLEEGVRSEATVMGTGFTAGSQIFIGDRVSPVENIVFQESSVLEITIPALAKGTYNIRIENLDGDSHTLYGAIDVEDANLVDNHAELSERCAEVLIYFSQANFSLDDTAKEKLDENISCFDNRFMYAIEGHCDERGTTEYNISLGQKRAEIVQEYLLSKGVLLDRIETVSYGEERPATQGDGEGSWSKNRRAIIKIND